MKLVTKVEEAGSPYCAASAVIGSLIMLIVFDILDLKAVYCCHKSVINGQVNNEKFKKFCTDVITVGNLAYISNSSSTWL